MAQDAGAGVDRRVAGGGLVMKGVEENREGGAKGLKKLNCWKQAWVELRRKPECTDGAARRV